MSVDASYMRGLDSKRRPPIVRFKQRPRFDQTLTDQRGMSTYVDEDVVDITSPDSGVTLTKTVIEWFAQMDKDPANYRTWAPAFRQMYLDWKEGNDTASIEGTHVKLWPLPSPAQVETLINAGYNTIEKVSKMPDDVAVMIDGGMSLRSKAKYWINSAEDIGAVVAEAATLKADCETLRGQVEELSRKLGELKGENERLTQHFTGKEGYDVIAGRAQPAPLKIVQAAQPQAVQQATVPQPIPPQGPTLMTLDNVKSLSMAELRDYCYEHDVKPHTSKEETYKRLVEAKQVA